MSKLIGIKVDVTKLDKTKFFKADSGAVYADLDVWVNEDADEDHDGEAGHVLSLALY